MLKHLRECDGQWLAIVESCHFWIPSSRVLNSVDPGAADPWVRGRSRGLTEGKQQESTLVDWGNKSGEFGKLFAPSWIVNKIKTKEATQKQWSFWRSKDLHLSASRYLAFDYVERLSLEDQDRALQMRDSGKQIEMNLGSFVPCRKMARKFIGCGTSWQLCSMWFCHVLSCSCWVVA